MNILDRFILSLYTFCLAVISLLLILTLTGAVQPTLVGTYADIILKKVDYRNIALIVSTVFLIISLRFLLSGKAKSTDKRGVEKVSELGSIVISLTSIDSIIMSVIKKMDGVMEVKADIARAGEQVRIKLRAIVTPERSIPELSALMQARTKEAIESIAGVGVETVEVDVEDVVQTIRPSVRSRVE